LIGLDVDGDTVFLKLGGVSGSPMLRLFVQESRLLVARPDTYGF